MGQHCLPVSISILAADVLESVVLLGSEKNNALLLFNSSLVCHLLLDHEFGCIALVGCYSLQLSLHCYEDDQLPRSPGSLVCCVYVSPLLFVLTTNGIVCILKDVLDNYVTNLCPVSER